MSQYRSVLSLPGVPVTMLVMLFARLPQTASGVTITLHVLGSLHRGYAAAGTVGAVATISAALGAPIAGRAVDRVGLRPLVLICGFPSIALWLAAPAFSYPVLLIAAFPCGALTLPASSLARQVLATQVPQSANARRTRWTRWPSSSAS